MSKMTIDHTHRALVFAEAEKVFGSAEKAEKWLHQEQLALGAAPLSLLDSEAGIAEVRKILAAIATGGVV